MDDAEIIGAFRKNRDPELFRVLMERHQARVFRLVASILGPGYAAEAEEVTQDIFLDVFRKLESFRAESRFSTWLYRVAWNRTVDHRRRASFQKTSVPDVALSRLESGSNPQRDLENGDRRRRLLAALETLPVLYRTLVHLHYWLDCSLAEIEELTGVPPGTSKSYLARARKMLEKELPHG